MISGLALAGWTIVATVITMVVLHLTLLRRNLLGLIVAVPYVMAVCVVLVAIIAIITTRVTS